MKLTEIKIERFRGIEEQTIDNIENALILIGKNNSGKSAVLTAIRTVLGNYAPKTGDFYKNSNDIKISVKFCCPDTYMYT